MTLIERIKSTIRWVRYRTGKGLPGSRAIFVGRDGKANVKSFKKNDSKDTH